MKRSPEVIPPVKVSTGIAGLDKILSGGLPEGNIHLLQGSPGTGKTTTAMQFLLEGARQGERTLYVTFLQSIGELEAAMASHGWSLAEVNVLELPEDMRQAAASEQTLFHPADIELGEVTDKIVEAIEHHQPQRLVLDSISELLVLVESPYQLRRQLLRLKQHLGGRNCTSLFTANDVDLNDLGAIQTMVHGVVELYQETPDYGCTQRRLMVSKMRGSSYSSGYHDFDIATGGIEVFPRLMLSKPPRRREGEVIASGNDELDQLLGGGLEEGTSCLLVGHSGTGKSTLASLYCSAAARRGAKSLFCGFDEREETFFRRSKGLGLDVKQSVDNGLITLRQINVGETTPGAFSQLVRQAVDDQGAKLVVIDSVTGYLNSMRNSRHLEVHLHELISYLASKGVLIMLIVSTRGFSQSLAEPIDASYIADTVVSLRFFEAKGRIRKSIAVLKKRYGDHASAIREINFDHAGVHVGEALTQFTGIMTGFPTYTGSDDALLPSKNTTS